MVGSVGMVRGVSRPNSLVIQEALNLLSALGGDRKGTTEKLLEEMKSVQYHNEAVLENAKEAVVKANTREAEVVEKEAELERNLGEAAELYSSRLSDITNSEAELQRRMGEAGVRIGKEDERLRKREGKLRQHQNEHRESIRAGKVEFEEWERVLEEDRQGLKELESSFEGREEEIKSDRAVLDDLQSSLDEIQLKLDARDARVLAAMKGEVVVGGE